MSAPALLAAIPLLTGVAVGALGHPSQAAGLIVLAAAWIAAALSLWAGYDRALIIAVLCGCLAAGLVLGARAMREADHAALLEWFRAARSSRPVRLTGVLREDATVTPFGVAVTIDARRFLDHDRSFAVQGGVRVAVLGALASTVASEWTQGRTISVDAMVREPVDYRNPGVPSERVRLARQGIALVGTVKSAAVVTIVSQGSSLEETAAALRRHVRRVTGIAVGRWSPRAAGVVTAILIGDRSGLDPEDERRLQEAGTYHVIAISGGNIALLTWLLVLTGRALGLSPRVAAAASILFLAFYGYAAGLAASVLRATLAGIIFLAARVLDHRGPALNALAVAAAIAAASTPLSALDPGFALSYGATIAIVIGTGRTPLTLRRLNPEQRWRRHARAALLTARALGLATLYAEAALAPLGARLFGRISVAGLALNFVAIPLMSAIQIAGLAAVVSAGLSASVASVCGWVAHVSTSALLRSAGLVDAAPWLVIDVPPPAMWLIVSWYSACWPLLCWRLYPRRWQVCLIIVALAVIAIDATLGAAAPRFARATRVPPAPPGWTRVVFIDVGQGDATLVWPAFADPLLVDAGGAPGGSFDLGRRVTVPALWAFGVDRLGSLVITHGDPDHVGGAPGVIRALRPQWVCEGIFVFSHGPMIRLHEAADRRGVRWRELRAGHALDAGAASIRVLHPPEPDWERRRVRNDDSVVLDVRLENVEIVLPGDISRDVERTIAGELGRARLVIVKAPHHGSAGSSSPEFIAAAHPAAVVFSAGRRNPFGHPAPAVVDRYGAAGARIFRTDEDGAVVVDTDGSTVVLWTWSGRRDVLTARASVDDVRSRIALRRAHSDAGRPVSDSGTPDAPSGNSARATVTSSRRRAW
jgi:competence protein ComEC